MSTSSGVVLVGDGIENPANALTMIHAAAMLGARCRFRDTKGLAQSVGRGSTPVSGAGAGDVSATLSGESAGQETRGRVWSQSLVTPTTSTEVKALGSRIIAFDNLPGAREVYGFRAGHEFAVLVGNERRGLSHEFASLATDRVQIPMHSGRINCLNVAAASAVALYYLCAPPVGPMAARKDPRTRRPELLLLGAGDHFELGSTIRSASAFGWERAFVEDRHRVWFGCNREIRSEGRAAARRGRNEILLIPCPPGVTYSYPRVTVITCKQHGVPLHRANFTGGPSQLIVIPDESQVEAASEDWSRCGRQIEFAHLQLPNPDFTYHYRLLATIALAEISRQVGRRPTVKVPTAPRPPIYDHAGKELAEAAGEFVSFDELLRY